MWAEVIKIHMHFKRAGLKPIYFLEALQFVSQEPKSLYNSSTLPAKVEVDTRILGESRRC